MGKLCRLSYCMYISLNSSKTFLKQNSEQMEESFMLLPLLAMYLYQIHCSNKTAVISNCNPYFKYSTCPGDNFELTNLHINNLSFQQ